MGKGIVDSLKKEYDIELHTKGFEIHPDIPEAGVAASEYFPDAEQKAADIQASIRAYGVEFIDIEWMPNSNKVLQILEYAATVDKDEAYATAIYHALFFHGINIGRVEEIKKIATSVGITAKEVDQVLATDEYAQLLKHNVLFCSINGIESVPTFIVNEKMAVAGAQSPDFFRKVFAKLAAS